MQSCCISPLISLHSITMWLLQKRISTSVIQTGRNQSSTGREGSDGPSRNRHTEPPPQNSLLCLHTIYRKFYQKGAECSKIVCHSFLFPDQVFKSVWRRKKNTRKSVLILWSVVCHWKLKWLFFQLLIEICSGKFKYQCKYHSSKNFDPNYPTKTFLFLKT